MIHKITSDMELVNPELLLLRDRPAYIPQVPGIFIKKAVFYCQLSKSTESLQARFTLSSSFVVVQSLSYVWFFETAWTVAYQAPLSLGFPRQEYRSGLPFSSLGDLPDPGMEPASPALAGGYSTTEPPGKPNIYKFRSCLFSPPAVVTTVYFCHNT